MSNGEVEEFCKGMVTIAIPCYNHSKYVEYCLDSVLKQNYKNIEILIIDDGSSDNSVEVIKGWKQNNPTVNLRLIKRKNKGLNHTLNELVKKSKGEYITLLASDDALTLDGITTRVKALEKFEKKDIVIADAHVIDEENKILFNSAIVDLYNGNKEDYLTDEGLKYSIVNKFSIPGPVMLARKSVYSKIGSYPTNIFAEDIYFYLKVIGRDMLLYIDEYVAYYRRHSNNTGGNKKFSREISKTFIISYLHNLKYYKGSLKLRLIKKLLGRIYAYIKG